MYKLAKNGVVRLDDMAFIPADPANKDWQKYQQWLSEGNKPEPMFTLDELKQQLKQRIRQLRKQKENEGIIVVGSGGSNQYKFDTSLTGRANTQSVLNSFQMGFLDPATQTVHWKFMDGTFVDLTYDQLKELAGFALQYIEALFQAESAHYQAIDVLTTLDEARTYDVNSNWPSNQYQSKLLP